MTPTPLKEPARRRAPVGPTPAVRLPGIMGESRAMRAALGEAVSGRTSHPELLVLAGEPGTGKTLIARALHQQSEVCGGPFLVMPCTAFTPDMVTAEILGDEDTGRPGLLTQARGGTLLLEDAHRMPLDVARGIVELWEAGDESLPHLIATAAASPAGVVGLNGGDSPDGNSTQPEAGPLHILLQASGTQPIVLPPLRDRSGDIQLLTRHFLREWALEHEVEAPRLEDPARTALEAHTWPGNVRELKGVVQSAADLAPGSLIREEHLRIRTRSTRGIQSDGPSAADMILIPAKGKSWANIEEEAVRATLRITNGNRSQAARILGVSRPTLGRKIQKYDVDIPA